MLGLSQGAAARAAKPSDCAYAKVAGCPARSNVALPHSWPERRLSVWPEMRVAYSPCLCGHLSSGKLPRGNSCRMGVALVEGFRICFCICFCSPLCRSHSHTTCYGAARARRCEANPSLRLLSQAEALEVSVGSLTCRQRYQSDILCTRVNKPYR